MMDQQRIRIAHRVSLTVFPWLLAMCSCVMGGKTTFSKYTLTSGDSSSIYTVRCAHNATGGSYAGFRIPTSGDDCEPVTNMEFYTNGEEAGYQYYLKEVFRLRASLPDNLAPNPTGDYTQIPGIVGVGTSIEFTYTKTDTVGYSVDFVDENWQKLIMVFVVTEPAVSVEMNSLDYATGAWGGAEYCSGFPFSQLREYRVKFTFTASAIEVHVNGNLYYVFLHQLPFTLVRWVRLLMKPPSITSGIQVSDVRVVMA